MPSKSNTKLYVSIVLSVIWLFSGLILNLVQFTCYVTIRRFSKPLYRKINYYLTYSMWSQVVAMAEWYSNSKLTVYYADEVTRVNFGREHGVAVMNHRYEIDWLVAWMLCDKYHILGSAKSFAKKSLQWIPVLGWGWIFCEMIFLERIWDKDSLILGKSLDRLMEYTDTVLLLLFAEGTRYTEEKYNASVEFAKEKGLEVLKYHLQPRTKGFVFTIERLKDKLPAVYSVQLAFKETVPEPTLTTILNGLPLHAHVFVKRIAVSDIPPNSSEEISEFLHTMYKEKDDLMQYFKDNGEFPGICQSFGRRKSPLIHSIVWLTLMTYMFCYFIFKLVISESLIFLYITLIGLVAAFLSVLIMIRSTKAKKGSSYGRAAPKKVQDSAVANGTPAASELEESADDDDDDDDDDERLEEVEADKKND